MSCSRRKFLAQSGWLLAPVALGACSGLVSGLLTACGPVRSVQATAINGILSVDRSYFEHGGFVSVHTDNLPAPVYVGRNTDEQFSAVLMLCTHKACVLEPAGRYLTCPCHGSEFYGNGKLLKEPAATDLKKYLVTTDDKQIHIHVR